MNKLIQEYRERQISFIGKCRIEPRDIRIKKYVRKGICVSRPEARSWTIYLNDEILAVTMYRKGAIAIAKALNATSKTK